MRSMVSKKRPKKLAALPDTINVSGTEMPTEEFLDAFIADGMTAEDIAPYFKRSVASIEQALNGRTKETIDKRDNALVLHKMKQKAKAGDSLMIKFIAENKLGYHKDSLEGTALPTPLIINFPTSSK